MERRTDRNDRNEPAGGARSKTVVDARMSLAVWLRAGRVQRGLSLDDVSRVTKIQPRILERLEGGTFDGLPADVFVRGFVRSVARCVGLDEDEALRRHAACGGTSSTVTVGPSVGPAARAMVEAMADLAPNTASPKVLRDGARPATRSSGSTGSFETVEPPPVAHHSEPAEPELFPSGSLQDLPKAASSVETFMLPITGTLAPVRADHAIVVVEAPPVAEAIIVPASGPAIEALVEAGSVPGPVEAASIVVELAALVDDTAAAEGASSETKSSKKRRRAGKGRGKRKAMATGTPAEASPVVAGGEARVAEIAAPVSGAVEALAAALVEHVPQASDVVEHAAVERIAISDDAPSAVQAVVEHPASYPATVDASAEIATATAVEDAVAFDEPIATETWHPTMPTVVTPSKPWRRPPVAATSPATVVPSLVIDDADPEGAEQLLEERAAAKSVLTTAQRRSFLPPILLDREDRSARQGGLTLAVIILLIAATLTLSYLMRRPSSSGDGVTQRGASSELVG